VISHCYEFQNIISNKNLRKKLISYTYSAMEKYVHYAEKDKKPGLLTLWKAIKEEEEII
jgi:regulatory protein YycI of two-component signal transduction system YycFG